MNERRAFALALSAALLWQSAASAVEPGKFAPGRGAVFPPDRMSAFLHPCSRPAPARVEGAWQPDDAQIAQMEARMPAAFADAAWKEVADIGGRLPDPSDYYRQYVGLVVSGRRVIYTNGFGSFVLQDWGTSAPSIRARLDWHVSVQTLCDGGMGGFGAQYDVGTRKFREFQFDGCMCRSVSGDAP